MDDDDLADLAERQVAATMDKLASESEKHSSDGKAKSGKVITIASAPGLLQNKWLAAVIVGSATLVMVLPPKMASVVAWAVPLLVVFGYSFSCASNASALP